MKRSKTGVPLLAFALFAGNALFAPRSFAGGSEGHGGNRYTIEFQTAARIGLLLLQGLEASAFPSVDRVALAEKIDTVALTSETPKLSGTAASRTRVAVPDPRTGRTVWEKRCAVNYPRTSEIVVSESCWDSEGMRENLAMKITVALHEYFSFLGIERDTSPVSSAIAARLYEKVRFDRKRIAEKGARLREAFGAAKPEATLDDLLAKPMEYGRPWTCKEISVLDGVPYETTVPAAYAFRDDLMSVGADAKDLLGRITHFERNPVGLSSVGTASEANTLVIRLSPDGDLLIEKVSPAPKPKDDPSGLPKSLSWAGRTVSAYQICSLFPSAMRTRLADLETAFRERYLFDFAALEVAMTKVKESAAYRRCSAKNRKSDCTDALHALHNALETAEPKSSLAGRAALEARMREFKQWATSLSDADRRAAATSVYASLFSKWKDLEAEYLDSYEQGYSFHGTVSVRELDELKRRDVGEDASPRERLDCLSAAYEKTRADYSSRRSAVFAGLDREIQRLSEGMDGYAGD